jgi:hypothetical protein
LLRQLVSLTFLIRFQEFGNHFAQSFFLHNSLYMMDPTSSRDMSSCSATDLDEFRHSSKISSWMSSIIFKEVDVLGRPGLGATQVEKSPRLNWTTQFLTVAYKSAYSPNVSVRRAWIYFCVFSCRENNCWELISLYCWNFALRFTCFIPTSVIRKDLQFDTEQTPI